MSNRNDPIDLTVDSSPEIAPVRLYGDQSAPRARLPEADDDEPIYLGSDSDIEMEMPGLLLPARRPTAGRQFRADMANLDAALLRHGQHILQLGAEEAAAVRAAENRLPEARPDAAGPAAAGPARIGLGGAVYRGGDREVRFAPGQAAQHFRVNRGGQAEDESVADRVRGARNVAVRGLPGHLRAAADLEELLRRENLVAEAGALQQHLDLLRGLDLIVPNQNGAGPARARPDDVATIISKVTVDTVPPARHEHTRTWDLDEIEAAAPIEVDDFGEIVKSTKKSKPFLACANCPEPLRVSAAARDSDDRIWGLKCGHLVDERCLKQLSTPETPEEQEPSPKRRKRGRKQKPAPVEHTWNCPTCEREHISQLVEGAWKQKSRLGGTLLFV